MFVSKSNKILITGSSGFVGSLIIPFLQNYGFFIRGYDQNTDSISDEFVKGQIEDTELLRKALIGVDAIIHLAAFSDEGDFLQQILKPNIVGVYSLFEAIKDKNIERIILASSTQAADIEQTKGIITANLDFSTSYYGLSKIWLEKVAEMNTRLYNLNIIAARLGWIIRSRREFEELKNNPSWQKYFFSHLDAQKFFLSCLKAPVKGFNLINAVSKSVSNNGYSMMETKLLIGFQPEDVFPEGLIPQIMA